MACASCAGGGPADQQHARGVHGLWLVGLHAHWPPPRRHAALPDHLRCFLWCLQAAGVGGRAGCTDCGRALPPLSRAKRGAAPAGRATNLAPHAAHPARPAAWRVHAAAGSRWVLDGAPVALSTRQAPLLLGRPRSPPAQRARRARGPTAACPAPSAGGTCAWRSAACWRCRAGGRAACCRSGCCTATRSRSGCGCASWCGRWSACTCGRAAVREDGGVQAWSGAERQACTLP